MSHHIANITKQLQELERDVDSKKLELRRKTAEAEVLHSTLGALKAESRELSSDAASEKKEKMGLSLKREQETNAKLEAVNAVGFSTLKSREVEAVEKAEQVSAKTREKGRGRTVQ